MAGLACQLTVNLTAIGVDGHSFLVPGRSENMVEFLLRDPPHPEVHAPPRWYHRVKTSHVSQLVNLLLIVIPGLVTLDVGYSLLVFRKKLGQITIVIPVVDSDGIVFDSTQSSAGVTFCSGKPGPPADLEYIDRNINTREPGDIFLCQGIPRRREDSFLFNILRPERGIFRCYGKHLIETRASFFQAHNSKERRRIAASRNEE